MTAPTTPADRPELSTTNPNTASCPQIRIEGFRTPSTAISWKAHEIGPQWTSCFLTGSASNTDGGLGVIPVAAAEW
ncbi:hypothetical protein GCM10017567_41380 [Amycolatopsis bullii]|uniref:Uncharacterized protein n=1 Tax=Amycolatopsis bullii TaxID=941987 RepID=A0ABQ3KFQ2_9PSEU|nr:hypothetical protein GCM10017567_41380 [Amycolatopsis bullii]